MSQGGTFSIVVVGAGIGGLAAALHLAASGRPVLVLEREAMPGGKLQRLGLGGVQVDAGPPVLALRPVFQALFAAAGARLEDHLSLQPLRVLGRHLWPDGSRLDLLADAHEAAEAIGDFAGAEAARGFLAFRDRAARCWQALEKPFLTVQRPGMLALGAQVGLGLRGISPFATLWEALGEHFTDPRLRQLFGRMAGYVGSSPLQAPATLMLVAHIEMSGLFAIEGGMDRLPQALAGLAAARGVQFRHGATVAEILVQGGRVAGLRLADGERIVARQVIWAGDAATLAAGQAGAAAARAVPAWPASRRSYSAFGWAMAGRAEGPDLPMQTVFHPADPTAEYVALARGQMPADPSVTLLAQARRDPAPPPEGTEPLMALVQAPARADSRDLPAGPAEAAALAAMEGAGVRLRRDAVQVITPRDRERQAPGSGGAIYGQAVQGWQSIFSRPAARTPLPGLVLAGGTTHPGAGMAMAALSGQLAASAVIGERA
ncbi:phytoene desaturase family protein [Falsiroseomonas tokyonensis]|uniref:Phytoene desaturase family protein n=1 Tax=Falsiroseomonas tokyonensis TaxID=430521 RepID=A0ABV7BLW3_9PROT|nr:FAD-dependent oxidoreductase [Falsiroseomonas tokyonensis]MBU8536555.1 FAD-dependent oxidoreductase [Falsiroseomonas tokyonensis]